MIARLIILVAAVAPVPGPVVQRFVAPACERCAGHRGVTIASEPGLGVRAPVAGTVVFVGEVAGRLYVVVRPDRPQGMPGNSGVKVTVGWLTRIAPEVALGNRVVEGQGIGISGPMTHLSVRVNGVHVEPLTALGLGWARLRGPGGVLVGRGPAHR